MTGWRPFFLLFILIFSRQTTSAWAGENAESWIASTPIPLLPVQQQPIASCWSYAFTGLLENYAHRIGKPVKLAPEYLTFSGIALPLAKQIQKAHQQFLQSPSQKNSLVDGIQTGTQIQAAIQIAEHFGMAPAQVVKSKTVDRFVPIDLDPAAHRFQSWLEHEVQGSDLAEDVNAAAHQIYSQLYSIFQLTRTTPKSNFNWDGKTYTPVSFLHEYLNFNASKLVQIEWNAGADSAKTSQFINSIDQHIQLGEATTLEFPILAQDAIHFNRDLNQPDFIFDETRATSPWNKNLGMHVAVVVNTLKDTSGNVKAFVIQNSYGLRGRDRFGRTTSDEKQRGYDVVTIDYLKKMPRKGIPVLSTWSYSL